MGTTEGEYETFKRLICEVYPKGIVSIVSDTWDLWKVLTDYLPRLKEEIVTREGKVVIRPDSGDPILILCGNPNGKTEQERKGVVELLWETFGGTINANLQPVGSLSDFIGLPAAGLWTLTVTDSFNDDGGAITGWGLEICTLVPTCSATITAISATEDVCTGTTAADFATAEASITYSAGASTDFLLEWFDDAAFTTAATALVSWPRIN